VVDAVLAAVREQRLSPGARLVERELALTAGASRLAVRNALLRLAGTGLVELSPNRGAAIARCSDGDAHHIFEARHVIEAALLRSLASRATPEAVARLAGFVEDERQAYAAGRVADARRLSREFHCLVADLAGNPVLTRVLRQLIDKQPLLTWFHGGARPCFCGNAAHALVADAVARGDAERAVEINAEHLAELERRLLEEPGDEEDAPERRPRRKARARS
jgi:DNA-binding GntR family transcriptional regulator